MPCSFSLEGQRSNNPLEGLPDELKSYTAKGTVLLEEDNHQPEGFLTIRQLRLSPY